MISAATRASPTDSPTRCRLVVERGAGDKALAHLPVKAKRLRLFHRHAAGRSGH